MNSPGNAYEIHALSGAYAVDALDPEEKAQFEEHLGSCAACRAEVASLRETTALLAETAEADPPPALRDRLPAPVRVPAADAAGIDLPHDGTFADGDRLPGGPPV